MRRLQNTSSQRTQVQAFIQAFSTSAPTCTQTSIYLQQNINDTLQAIAVKHNNCNWNCNSNKKITAITHQVYV